VTSIINALRDMGELLSHFGTFIWSHKVWWMVPVVLVLLLVLLLLVLAETPLGPFIYTLF